MYIILVAMVGYGVTSRSMYDYNSDSNTDDLTFDGRSIFRHIIYPVYYFMYGSFDGERSALDRKNCVSNLKFLTFGIVENPDTSTSIATQVLLAFHMLLVNILLVNLLIAMFR